jgi:hypothetical protein
MHMLVPLLAALAVAADPVLDALDTELARTVEAWKGQEEAPYYIGYRVTDGTWWDVEALHGALSRSDANRTRWLDVSVRVGDRALDSTHPIRERYSLEYDWQDGRLPVEGDDRTLRTPIWRATSDMLRNSSNPQDCATIRTRVSGYSSNPRDRVC